MGKRRREGDILIERGTNKSRKWDRVENLLVYFLTNFAIILVCVCNSSKNLDSQKKQSEQHPFLRGSPHISPIFHFFPVHWKMLVIAEIPQMTK